MIKATINTLTLIFGKRSKFTYVKSLYLTPFARDLKRDLIKNYKKYLENIQDVKKN